MMYVDVATRAAILRRVVEHLAPNRKLDGPWHILPPAPDTYGPVAQPAGALAALTAEFGAEALRAVGAVRVRKNGPHLTPGLTGPGRVVVFRRAPAEDPIGILAGPAYLPRGDCPLEAVRQDGWSAGRIAVSEKIVGVSSATDATLYRSLGFAATLVVHLRSATLPMLDYLQSRFGKDNHARASFGQQSRFAPGASGEEQEDEDDEETEPAPAPPQPAAAEHRPMLVVPAADLGAFDRRPRPSLVTVMRHLSDAERVLGFKFERIATWFPPRGLGAAVRLCLRVNDPPGAVRAVAAGMRLDDLSFVADMAAKPGPPASYAAAEEDLVRALRYGNGDDIKAVSEAYERVVERDLRGPLREWGGLVEYDPLRRAFAVQLSDVAGFLARRAPAVRAQDLTRHLRFRAIEDAPPPPEADLDEYLRLSAHYVRLVAAVTKYGFRYC